jgi:hypothetical protein
MRWALLFACLLPWIAHADTIYLCKAYSGGMFWSSATCGSQKATIDRIVTVPDGMSWDQKMAMGEAARAQGQAAAGPQAPSSQVYQQAQNSQASRQAECDGLRASIANLDSQMRLPQSGQMMDWLKQRRQQLSDQRYRMQC